MTAEDLNALKAAIDAARKAHSSDELQLRLRLVRHPDQDVAGKIDAMIRASVCADIGGDGAQARSLAEGALELATLHNLPASRLVALCELGVQLRWAGDLVHSESLLREAVEIADGLGNKREQARSHSGLATTLYRRGQSDLAFDEGELAARFYRDLGDLTGAARILHLQAQIRKSQGLLEDARALLEEVIELDSITGDEHGQGRSIGNLALLLMQMQKPDEAAERLQQAIKLFEKVRSPADTLRALCNLASVRTSQGHFEVALQTLRDVAQESKRIGNMAELSNALCFQADTLQYLGRDAEALELARQAEAATGANTANNVRFIAGLIRCRISLNARDAKAALGYISAAEELARELNNQLDIATALRLKAEALRSAGMLADAREATLECIEILDAARVDPSREYLKCVTLAAQLENDQGNQEEAGFLVAEGNRLRELLQVDDTTPDPDLRRVVKALRELSGQA
ncbi:MAG: tetratricopeptide repeat protein [Planctomycetes bacterium]|nr:tetratricopeptide repeat protein [Planctomycetota bacterium]